jgi:hypothetical protein
MSWFQKIIYGVDLDAEQARQNELDVQLKAMNDKALSDGVYDQSTYDAAEAHRAQTYLPNVAGDVGAAFDTGWNEGAANIRHTIGATVDGIVVTPFKVIPWQVWLIAAGFGAWKLGLLDGILRKR